VIGLPAADFYGVLGVDRTASQDDIRRAYRRLLRELHPDVSEGDPADTQRLHAVLEAYSVLGHPERRAAYDQALKRAEAEFNLLSGLVPPRRPIWPEPSIFDEPDIFRILFRWFF
jgi:DnaJ-class molecular chaperone